VDREESKDVAPHDLGLPLLRRLALEQGVVLGDADAHEGKGDVVATADPVGVATRAQFDDFSARLL